MPVARSLVHPRSVPSAEPDNHPEGLQFVLYESREYLGISQVLLVMFVRLGFCHNPLPVPKNEEFSDTQHVSLLALACRRTGNAKGGHQW